MPLPDERPRQSVANLIGRFEQQTKRSSIGPGTPIPNFQRAVSVTSQTTGDSAKADEKEKREWPPRNTTTETTPSKPILSDASRSSVSVPTPVRKATGGATAPAPASVTTPAPEPTSEPVPVAPSPIVTSAPEPQTEPAPVPSISPPAISPSSSSATARVKPASAKPKSETTSTKTPLRTPARTSTASSKTAPSSPTKTPSHPPVTKPLKAQLTGQSNASNTSTIRARSRASNATSTPIRSKTPTVTPSRPKTPSGLLAPTAASLAKAKNTPPVPTPVKKTTASPNASALIDRLSKPTAASASKARSPPGTPSKTVKQSPARTSALAPTRGSTLKPRVGHAPARIQQEKEKKAMLREDVNEVNGTAGDVMDTAVLHAATEVNEDVSPSHIVDEQEQEKEEEVVESYDDDFVDVTIIHEEPISHDASTTEEPALAILNKEEHAVEAPPKDEDIVVPSIEENGHAVLAEEEHDGPSSEVAEHVADGDVHPEELAATVDGEAKGPQVNGLEGMVNMLEATHLRPPSVSSSVIEIDDAGSIPDEDI